MSGATLSLVVPAYNEAHFIENTLRTLDAIIKDKGLSYEVVVVDDGSKDKTSANATRFATTNGHIRVISYAKNVGKGYAEKTGFMQSNGDIVVFADSDLEIDFSSISRYIETLKYYDIVIASKSHPDSQVDVPLIRRFLSCAFNTWVRLLTGVPFKDTQSGLKAMRKKAFIDIFPRLAVKRYAFDVELLAVAHLYGLKIAEMPIKIKLAAQFKLRQMWLMFVDLLGIAYRLRVINWYQRSTPMKNSLQRAVSLILREH